MACSECRNDHNKVTGICATCAIRLKQIISGAQVLSMPYAAAHAGLPISSAAASPERLTPYKSLSRKEQYQAVIGHHQHYYLKKFMDFDSDSKAQRSWHWPAFLLTFYWMLYRKMWVNAVIYLLLSYSGFALVGSVTRHLANSAGLWVILLYAGLLLSLCVLPAIYANALYYQHCRKLIANAQQQTDNPNQVYGLLASRGGTSNLMVSIMVVVGLSMSGLLAASAIPAYESYQMRSKTTEAIQFGQQATIAVSQYYRQHQQLPLSLAQTGFQGTWPHAIQALDFNRDNGTLTLTLTGSSSKDQLLAFVPIDLKRDSPTWECQAVNIAHQYLPVRCQHAID
jgi:type II secretory pathway pseudopilin PulG